MIRASELRLATGEEKARKRCGGSGASSCLGAVKYILVGQYGRAGARCNTSRPLCNGCGKKAAQVHGLRLPMEAAS